LGKFFDAMQRAAGANTEQNTEIPVRETLVPELDDALLDPDWPDGDVFPLSETDEKAARIDTKMGADDPSAAIRTSESEFQSGSAVVREVKEIPPPAGSLRIRVEGPESVRLPRRKSQSIEMIHSPVETVVRVHPAYDRIVQRLKTYRKTPRQSVILVTGAIASEGASTVARNVATALSQAGPERILLIDGNLRTPSQHEAFGVARDGGFSDVLRGEATLTHVINDDVGSGISLMTCGTRVKSPSQVLTATAIAGATGALLSLFDWIVIDGSPATEYPDVASIGTACGGAILVVRAENTRLEVAEEAKEILEGTGAEMLGAVLNRRRYHIPEAIYRRL
jgi:capsular exopolysaccharide synthesis family protein